MKIYSVTIENFRGIRSAKLVLPDHAVLISRKKLRRKISMLRCIERIEWE